jgi:hypothetical protein
VARQVAEAPGVTEPVATPALTAPTPVPRISGWPRKALFLGGAVMTVAIGSTLLPHHASTDPVVASVYISQLQPTVTSVEAAAPALRSINASSGSPSSRSQAGADGAAAASPAFVSCSTTLAEMGVPAGLGHAHGELRNACANYQSAATAAQAWQTSGTGDNLIKLRVSLNAADRQWRTALAAIYRVGGRPNADGTPGSPAGSGNAPGGIGDQ